MLYRLGYGVVLFSAMIAVGCMSGNAPLEVVERVDLNRYAGRWYEVASYPAPFQKDCTGTVADYEVRNDGKVKVTNACYDHSLDGPVRQVTGTARVVDPESNAKLKVSFFWPFEGDYWIIDLDEEYTWAVVGEPKRRYLWILSRQPSLNEVIYEAILSRLPDKGYDPSLLQKTLQR